MPRPPERILLLRSGRHLSVALASLKAAFPDSRIQVVATRGTEAAVAREGVSPRDCFVYDAHPTFDAWPLLRSGLYVRLRRAGYDRVAVLWQDPEGRDRANVDRTALLLSPPGFVAITPDGEIIPKDGRAAMRRQVGAAVASIGTLLVVGLMLRIPARLARLTGR